MKRWILILMAFLTVLSSVSGEAFATPKRKAQRGGDARNTITEHAAASLWELGPPSHTQYFNFITGTNMDLTLHQVGFRRMVDGSLPKVGETYAAGVIIGSTRSTAVAFDLALPPHTVLDIDPNNPAKRVHCSGKNLSSGQEWEWKDADCDQSPTPGFYGAHFAPSSSENNGLWFLDDGEMLYLEIPIRSQAVLNGMPSACLRLSVFAAGSLGDGWDHPGPTDTCPLRFGHGAFMGVFVTPGTTVTPPPTVDHGTQPPPTKHKKKGKKGKGKKGRGKRH